MLTIKRTNLLWTLTLLFSASLIFFACSKQDNLKPSDDLKPLTEQSIFQQHLADNTQWLDVKDQGNGYYYATGEQGTVINIQDALVDASGNRVRGDIRIELIEIYAVADMILNRKQTLADYDGQIRMLESGGEIYIQVYQNDQKLSVDSKGTMQLLLPTENTGGAKENMELYYGEVLGEQVMWQPTGQQVRVVNTQSREEASYYLAIIQGILGWVNVDVVFSLGGDPVDCIRLTIDCPEICSIEPFNTASAIYVNGINSAFEMQYIGGNQFVFCDGGPFPMGGISVTFVIVVDCGDGVLRVVIKTVTLNGPVHQEIIKCGDFQMMDQGMLEQALHELTM